MFRNVNEKDITPKKQKHRRSKWIVLFYFPEKSLTKQLLWGYCSCLISSCNKGSMYSFQINVFEAKVFILIHHINFERFLFYRRCPRAILSFSQTFDSLHRHEFHLIIWKPSRMFNTGKIQLSLKKHVDCKFLCFQ